MGFSYLYCKSCEECLHEDCFISCINCGAQNGICEDCYDDSMGLSETEKRACYEEYKIKNKNELLNKYDENIYKYHSEFIELKEGKTYKEFKDYNFSSRSFYITSRDCPHC